MSRPDAPNSSDLDIGPVVESFLARFRRGERPALSDLIARHPDLAEPLREIIPALVALEQLGDSKGSSSGTRADRVGSFGGGQPESLGGYKILWRIGRGGMGVVYEAEHESLKSRVALKVMHPQFRADERYLRRFHVEARAAAALHHTNIVGVFDYGEQGGVCYYAMQYIRGQPLDAVLADLRRLRAEEQTLVAASPLGSESAAVTEVDWSVARDLMNGRFDAGAAKGIEIAGSRPLPATVAIPSAPDGAGMAAKSEPGALPPGSSSLGDPSEGDYFREVARLGARVADALEYAHRSGVLHRDIKPSNLLLDASGNVWVTDFGLAKFVEGDDVSRSHDLVGTLRYMAPERFRGISNRGADVYGLGATLYELLTLKPPFEGTDQIRLIDRIVHEAPAPPRSVDRLVPRDLETIVLKALAKDPSDRFASAGEMRDELSMFVEGRPIRSRRITPAERFFRWCKRNPGLAAATILAAVLTTALAVGATIAAKVYHDGREHITAVARDLKNAELGARRDLFEARAAQARASRKSRQVGQRFESLEALSESVRIGRALGYPPDRFDRLRDEAIASLMLPDLKPAGPPIALPDAYTAFGFDVGLTRYGVRHQDGTIVVRRFVDNREIARFQAKGDRDIFVFAFSPDGRYLASRDGATNSVWDVDRNTLAWTTPDDCRIFWCEFSPDSRRVALVHVDGSILVHDLAAGQSRRVSCPKQVVRLSYRPDGTEFAVCYRGNSNPTGCSAIIDAETGREIRSLNIVGDAIGWHPGGSTLAILDAYKQRVILFNASSGYRGETHQSVVDTGARLAFHPAGTLLARNGEENRLHLADPASGRERLGVTSRFPPVFTRDGLIFLSRGNQACPALVVPGAEYVALRPAHNLGPTVVRSSIHRDGRLLAMGTDVGLFLWDLARKTELGFLPIGYARHSAFEPSGDLVTNGRAGVLRWPVRVDPASGVVRVGPPGRLPLQEAPLGEISFDRTGRVVAAAERKAASVALDDRTLTIGPLVDCRSVSLSPDGRLLATCTHQDGGVTVWNLPDGARATGLPIEGVDRIQFSPDGKWLATSQPTSRLWEVGSWRETRRINGVFQSFSPDGRLGVVVDETQMLVLVEIETGRVVARLERPDQQPLNWATFSPDGSRLLATSREPPAVVVIDLRLIRRGLASMGLDWDAPAFPEDDPARADLPPLRSIEVDSGFLPLPIKP